MFRIHSHYKENNNGISLINFYINTVGKNPFMGSFFSGFHGPQLGEIPCFQHFVWVRPPADCVIPYQLIDYDSLQTIRYSRKYQKMRSPGSPVKSCHKRFNSTVLGLSIFIFLGFFWTKAIDITVRVRRRSDPYEMLKT